MVILLELFFTFAKIGVGFLILNAGITMLKKMPKKKSC